MINVSIAKLGASIQTVAVEDASPVMTALKEAGYSLDSVLSVKRNGTTVDMDTTLSDGDILMVSQEKVKGGSGEDAASEEGSVVRLKFDVEVDQTANANDEDGTVAYLSNQSTFSILKDELHKRGISMDSFVRLQDAEGNNVTLSDNLVDLASYIIVVSDKDYSPDEY